MRPQLSSITFSMIMETIKNNLFPGLTSEDLEDILKSCSDWENYKVELNGFVNDQIQYAEYYNTYTNYLVSVKSNKGFLITMSCELSVQCSTQMIEYVDMYDSALTIYNKSEQEVIPDLWKSQIISEAIESTVKERIEKLEV